MAVAEDGGFDVTTGGASLGQGVETVIAQIAADALGVDPAEIDVTVGDTDLVSAGGGSWASRSTIFSGGAVRLAADATAERARAVAAELLEAAPGDIRLEDGRAVVAGSGDRGVTLAEIAAACDPDERRAARRRARLTAARTFVDAPMTYPYGVHLAQVEVDPRPAACGCCATSSPTRSGARSTRRSSPASSWAARPRASAAPCSRRSATTPPASRSARRSWTT